MERLIVLVVVAMLVMELLAKSASRMKGTPPPDVLRALERRMGGAPEPGKRRSLTGRIYDAPSVSTRSAAEPTEEGRSATGRGRQQTARRRGVADGEYLGSMAYSSGQGQSMMYQDESDDLSEDGATRPDGTPNPGPAPSGAIALAIKTLGDSGQMQHGAGAAIVLAEILGPPRAKSRRRPTAPQARWR